MNLKIAWPILLIFPLVEFLLSGELFYGALFLWLGIADLIRFIFEIVFPKTYDSIIINNRRASNYILILLILSTLSVFLYWFYFIR